MREEDLSKLTNSYKLPLAWEYIKIHNVINFSPAEHNRNTVPSICTLRKHIELIK